MDDVGLVLTPVGSVINGTIEGEKIFCVNRLVEARLSAEPKSIFKSPVMMVCLLVTTLY